MKIKKISLICTMVLLIISLVIIAARYNLIIADDQAPRARGGVNIQTEEERQALLQQWENGLQRFSIADSQHGGDYHFSRSFSSWVGFGHKTTFWIEDGEVVRRYFEQWDSEGETRTFNEIEEEVGSHSNGFHPQTMYDLYEECNGYLQSDLEEYEIWFSSDENGVIKSCGRYPYGCMDDCSDDAYASDFSFD